MGTQNGHPHPNLLDISVHGVYGSSPDKLGGMFGSSCDSILGHDPHALIIPSFLGPILSFLLLFIKSSYVRSTKRTILSYNFLKGLLERTSQGTTANGSPPGEHYQKGLLRDRPSSLKLPPFGHSFQFGSLPCPFCRQLV